MQSFFQTLLRPDSEEDPELTLIARAANILQVGEFQLLQLAYSDWHGRDMPNDLCTRMFQDYMLHNRIPSWARHFARWVIRQDEIGEIDYRDPRFHRYDNDYVTEVPSGVRKFVMASMIIVFLFAVGILTSHLAISESKWSSVLPPYFDQKELGARALGEQDAGARREIE